MKDSVDIFIEKLKKRTVPPVLDDPGDFADEVVGMLHSSRRKSVISPVIYRFAYALVLSTVFVLIALERNRFVGDSNTAGDIPHFIQNKLSDPEKTISNITTSINLVEQYKSFEQ